MKKILFLLIPFLSFSQESEYKICLAIFNDTASFAGLYNDNCTINPDLEVYEGQIVPVVSIIEYDNCSAFDFCAFFYKGKPYSAKMNELHFLDGDIKRLMDMRYDVKDSIRVLSEAYSLRDNTIKDKKASELINKSKISGAVITYAKLTDESEYTKGTGFKVALYNTSKKTIKYVSFMVTGINSVNDVVSTKTMKGVGPIRKDEEAVYEFNYVWHTDIVNDFKMTIKIQYMDGTFKTISRADNLILSGTSLVQWNETHRN